MPPVPPAPHEADAPRVAVSFDSGPPAARLRMRARAEELARRLGLPLALPEESGAARRRPPPSPSPVKREGTEVLLVVTDDRLELRTTEGDASPVFCDFEGGAFGYRRTRPLRGELLARAVGFKGAPLEVVDATAGLGRDAVLLALLGCRVTAVERNAVVHALFEDGVQRALRDPELTDALDDRVTLVHDDAARYLEAVRVTPHVPPPDVVTLDPMFPPRGSAFAKKELRTLALLLGGDEGDREAETARLLAQALRSGARRVVLKRPLRAPTLAPPDGGPAAVEFRGRSARFDVYLRPAPKSR